MRISEILLAFDCQLFTFKIPIKHIFLPQNKRFLAGNHRHNAQDFRVLFRLVMVAQDLGTKHLHLIEVTRTIDSVEGLLVR